MERISIKHPYGTIGQLRSHPYGRQGGLQNAVDGLSLARSSKEPDEDLDEKFFSDVSSVTFIGFSFWPENIQILNFKAIPNGLPIQSTAYGLPAPVIDDMEKLLPTIKFGRTNESALDFVISNRVLGFQID